MSRDVVRVAAIDCGTNSLRLLIADRSAGRLHEVSRSMRIVRLGEGVDRTGRLAPAALERAAAVLADYRAAIDAADVAAVRMVATSAVRDASNHGDFEAMVQRALGRPADIITGDEEAQLSFAGVCSGLEYLFDGDRFDGRMGDGQVLVADIGGGSTELVRGDPADGHATAAVSLDVGSVRMTERHIRHDPPTAAEVAAIDADVRAALRVQDLGQKGVVGWTAGDRLVGVAGTVTTLAALALGLERYDSALVHGAVLARAQVEAAVDELVAMDHDQRAARAVIHPGRVDVIAAGAVILGALVDHLGADQIAVSEHDILDGVALGVQA